MLADYLRLDLSEELRLSEMPEEKRRELEATLNTTLQRRAGIVVAGMLSEEGKRQLAELNTQGGEEFLSNHIPHLDMVLNEIKAEFVKEIIEMADVVREISLTTAQ